MAKLMKSMRVEPSTWDLVERFAKAEGIKVHSAIETLLLRGLGRDTKSPAKAITKQKRDTAAASHAKLDTSMVAFNPTRAPMQKASATTKKRWA